MIQTKGLLTAILTVCTTRSIVAEVGSSQVTSYSTDLCTSVIALAGTPDYRYLQENNIDVDIYDDGEEFECELTTGLTVPLKGMDYQMAQMRSLLNDGSFISGEMTMGVSDDMVNVAGDDAVYLAPGDVILAPRGSGRSRFDNAGSNDIGNGRREMKQLRGSENESHSSHRNLAQQVYEGPKPFLVVRVTDSNGLVHPDSPDTISDKIFGTYGDQVNIKSQFEACSHGKLQVTNEYTVDISDELVAPGVIEIDIPMSLIGNNRRAIRTEMIKATQAKLGLTLPGPFQNVMYVLEGCYTDCGWAAYAYVNGWLSIYQGDNYKYVSVQMHEVGHNLNLAHSGGVDGRSYTDHTCIMGNPYYEDDEGVMCYNPAKNFQISQGHGGWYNNSYDTKTWNTGVNGGTSWSGKIIGIADYTNNPNLRPVVVKIESGQSTDLFVGFNRAAGINKDVPEARNKVTVVQAGNNGIGYSQSYLKAKLSQGESYTVQNWRGSGLDMTILVKSITTNLFNGEPGYADILMTFGDPTGKPTTNPTTQVPTSSPTKLPTSRPSNNGSPTSTSCGNSICDSDEDSSTCPTDCLGRQIETTFDYNLGSGGNMFTVEAKRDILIESLAINSNSRGEGEVKVYTRREGYAGHISSSQGWQLIYNNPAVTHGRRGETTELGDFEEGISIPRGTSQSFFVTSTRGLVYKSGDKESSPFTSDESLTILQGIGTDSTFSDTVYSPRVWGGIMRYSVAPEYTCGDGICDVINEGSDSCPVDCADKELETTFDFSLGSSGSMFSVEALRDVSILSLVVNAMARGVGQVTVYTRSGNYNGHELSSEGWDLVYSNSEVVHNKRGVPTELGDFQNAVSIKSGAIQSFYVTSTLGLVYEAGTEEGIPYTSDESLVIYEGVGTTDEFSGTIHRPRVFGGVVRYNALGATPEVCGDGICAMTEGSESCPVDCADKELETTFEFSLGSTGSMFSIEALRDVSISSLVVNAMARGVGQVTVYTRNGSYLGHELSSEGWELIYSNQAVVHNKRGVPTELGDFQNAVSIKSGDIQSFLVTSTKGLVYNAGTEEGAPSSSDSSLVIHEGIGTTGDFSGVIHRPRLFGGAVSNHQIIADEPTTYNLNATDFYIQQVTLKSSALDVKVFRGFTNSAKEYVLEQQALDNVMSEIEAVDYIMKNYHPNGDYMYNTPYYEPESYFMAIYNGTESDDTLSFARPNGIVGVVSAQLRRKAPLIAGPQSSEETTQTVLPSVPLPSPHVYVANMRVDDKMQRKGIAMALLTAVKDYAMAWSVATHSNEGIPIILSVDNVNLPATALYEKFGFSYLEQNAVFRMMIMWPGKERGK